MFQNVDADADSAGGLPNTQICDGARLMSPSASVLFYSTNIKVVLRLLSDHSSFKVLVPLLFIVCVL